MIGFNKNNVNKSSIDVPRGDRCIVLYPTGNDNGTWKMYNLNTNEFVTKSQFKIIKDLTSATALIFTINKKWNWIKNNIK